MSIKFSSLAEGLKKARKQKGLTQERFARSIGFSTATVRNWEQGRAVPEATTLENLCDFYDCDLDYLFGRIDCKKHDVQFICDYTGLDEEAVKALHDNVAADAKNKGRVLSLIIKNRRFMSLLSALQRFLESLYHLALNDGTFPYNPARYGDEVALHLDALNEKCNGNFYSLWGLAIPQYHRHDADNLWVEIIGDIRDFVERKAKRDLKKGE